MTAPDILAPVADYITGLEQQIAALQAQVSTLQAEVPAKTRFGSSVTKPLATVEAAFGPLPLVRIYDDGAGPDKALAHVNAVRPRNVFVSYHGNNDPTALFNALVPGDKWAWYHEFDSAVVKGKITVPAWQAGMTARVAQATQLGCKGEAWQVVTGSSIADRVSWLLPDLPVAVDPYAHGGQDAPTLLAPILQALAGRRVGVTEIGTTGDRPSFVQSLAKLVGVVEFVCWFNSSGPYNGGTDYSIDGDAVSASAFRTLNSL